MYPTLEDGQILLVDKLHRTAEYGSIIVAHIEAENSQEEYIVKRIIAIGGDTIVLDYDRNIVEVNGQPISEPYLNLSEIDPMKGDLLRTYKIPDGYVFVLGDNRNYSQDSRSPKIGLLPQKSIIGKVILLQ